MTLERLFDVKGKVVLVTGSGTGLGAEMARGLARFGARLVISGRTHAEIESTRDDIIAEGGEAIAIPFDAARHADCAKLIAQAVAHYGRLDVVIINHGLGHGHAAESLPEEEWDRVMNINLKGCFSTAQAAGRQMLTQAEGGSIIIIGSTGGVVAFPNLLAYATSKAGAIQIAKQLAAEWGDRNIRVNALCPGYMTHRMKGTSDRYSGDDVDEWVLRQTPMKRWGRPEEMLGAVVFLASQASSFITGQVISVDGGYTVI
jgi:NAD(P)-dependent dehydrogenase (short-subunit alcohol dehydrogenase family)